ncbi:helix-turn-helix domain-containing protein [Flavihumibacter petaseus]|uniref:Putative AraC family transcriptional regulator n=1 Tax=Flavihumibacter petaseus NBRC 106054 TaxID=1220578 RepID=A0A0E9MUU3_9BACT|nr:helix-turn-helix domain-containing protein [Flavihumibacter petaseus]GAO41263.1 putative AraC family transcriptional regulator [Flavihumibacter petaseus NBRC 106054]
MIRYYTIQPPATLKHFVRFFWVLEGTGGYQHHSMATPCPELIFHYQGIFEEPGGTTSFSSGLHASCTQSRRFTTDTSFGIFGAYLYPYAVPHLFIQSAANCRDEMPSLNELLGLPGKFLEEQMMTAPDNTARLRLLTSFLELRLPHKNPEADPVCAVIRKMVTTSEKKIITQLANDAFLSQRQFERKFSQLTGMTPVLFSRITRFQLALNQFGQKRALTDIALDCGYYDQAHFIHDFKRFSGTLPKEYFAGKVPGQEWRFQ